MLVVASDVTTQLIGCHFKTVINDKTQNNRIAIAAKQSKLNVAPVSTDQEQSKMIIYVNHVLLCMFYKQVLGINAYFMQLRDLFVGVCM
jgi:hypothetical protein